MDSTHEHLKNKQEIAKQELIGMPLNGIAPIGENVDVIRVVGGWIYRFREGISIAVVYVPEPKNDDS